MTVRKSNRQCRMNRESQRTGAAISAIKRVGQSVRRCRITSIGCMRPFERSATDAEASTFCLQMGKKISYTVSLGVLAMAKRQR
jgi:hypothetical protein